MGILFYQANLGFKMQDIRWKQRFDNFQKAYTFLKKSVQQGTYNELQAAGLVQSFEFIPETHENLIFWQGGAPCI